MGVRVGWEWGGSEGGRGWGGSGVGAGLENQGYVRHTLTVPSGKMFQSFKIVMRLSMSLLIL